MVMTTRPDMTNKDSVIEFLIESFTEDPAYAVSEHGRTCYYRAPNTGAACAFGRLMTDEEYEACGKPEALPASSLLKRHYDTLDSMGSPLLNLVGAAENGFVDHIQAIHDTYAMSGHPATVLPALYAAWRDLEYTKLVDASGYLDKTIIRRTLDPHLPA